MSEQQSLRLVWIDMEMTGLNPATDAILEIAAVVTGPDLVPLVQVQRVVRAPDDMMERMSNRVRMMHTENGLLEKVEAGGIQLRQAEREILDAIAEHAPPGEGILCGNSVYHDWKFLVRHMPRLEQHLHFRQIDIGTLAVLVNAWFPALPFRRTATNHRAMGDVLESLSELRFYCEHAFKTPLVPRSLTQGQGG